MTKTGIIALLIVIAAIFTIGVVGFIFAKVKLSSNLSFQPASITVGKGSTLNDGNMS